MCLGAIALLAAPAMTTLVLSLEMAHVEAY